MYVMIDVETDGPIPGDFSMISFGAVIVEPGLQRSFYGELCPISHKWDPQALSISGFSREQTLKFPNPKEVMIRFNDWLIYQSSRRPRFIADNNGFDWQFINWYFHHFIGKNPFGYSSDNLNDIFKGMKMDMSKSFKYLRSTKHDHNPVNDAKGNAEALLKMKEMGLRINLVYD